MKNHSIKLLLAFSILAGSVGVSAQINAQTPALKAVYDFPALRWESEAIPIGNGYMGAMIFGGVTLDLIQVNEHTLWSGGPGKNPNYNGGHPNNANLKTILQNIRQDLQDKMTKFSKKDFAYINDAGKMVSKDYAPESTQLKEYIHALMGNKNDFGSYQTLGNINIAYPDTIQNVVNYNRILDIDNAIVTVNYTEKEGTIFSREYFMSYPHNVMVMRLTASETGKLNRVFWISTPQTAVTISAENNTITMTGKPADHTDNGLKFAQQIKIINFGGMLSTDGKRITVTDADEIVMLMSAATNYVQCMDTTFNYFSSENPLDVVKARMNAASLIDYETLKTAHIQDYKSLYDRMNISFNNVIEPTKNTKALLADYKNGKNSDIENLYLEILYFQFGRYLLIASSRPNSLPANLQGVWANGLKPPWNADYHTNINLQMNYWLAQQTNLAECHLPMIEYVKSLVPRGKETAQRYHCKQDGGAVRGWVIYHENNVWGNTAPGNWYEGFYFPAAAAWICQDIWEYYLFNNNKQILEDNYPILLDAALFWVDNLWTDERDGSLVANPSYSPEHGAYSLGASCDQAIIWELFDFVIKTSDILGKNSSQIEEIKTAKSRLAGPKIGLAGQFMEWKDEVTKDITGDDEHRHVNHLFWLHPGSQIIAGRSIQDSLYVDAMKKTLNTRKDGGTGWSKAWKINFWARLHDGNRSHKLLSELLKESTLTNLFDTHPPFQIDGNFGATAGMTEMLVQSQGGYIELLPALPTVWNSGSFKGIKARGNFEINAQWNNGELQTMEITSNSGNVCVLKYNNISHYTITERGGRNVTATIISDNKISFETEIGKIYDIVR